MFAHQLQVFDRRAGFGQQGPYSHKTSFDLIAQGFAGLMHVTGEPDGPPVSGDALPEDRRTPHPARVAPDRPDRSAILAAHEAALDAGREGYPDPATGLFVMTAATLWARGRCCDSGCRHCPYLAR